jgi:hypothetical protein
MVNATDAESLSVTIVAQSHETIEGLRAYLFAAGVTPRTTRLLEDLSALPSSTTSVVLFPDEFEAANVVTVVSSLRQSRPQLLVVVVTGAARRFRPAFDPDERSRLPIVFPKPAFSWSILDTIREHSLSERPR